MRSNAVQFEMLPWHPLTEFSSQSDAKTAAKDQDQTPVAVTETKTSTASPKASSTSTSCPDSTIQTPSGSAAKILLHDIVCYLYSSIRERMKRLDISGRILESAKHELITTGFVIEAIVGKTKFLIPKPLAFEQEGLTCPYKNTSFIKHSFFMGLGENLLKKDPNCTGCDLEYKIGTAGHTADMVTHLRDGTLQSYEVTLSTGNIVQNAQKYEGTVFTRITFLCETYDMARTVESKLKRANLPRELINRMDVLPLSTLLKKNRKPI